MGPCVLLPFLLKRKEKTKKKRPLKKMSQKEDASQNEDECANGWTTVTRKKKKKYAVQNKSLADEIGGRKELWKLDEEAAVFIYDTYYVGKIVHVFPQYATISIDYYEKRNKMSMTKNFCYHSIYSTKNFPHNSEGGPWKIGDVCCAYHERDKKFLPAFILKEMSNKFKVEIVEYKPDKISYTTKTIVEVSKTNVQRCHFHDQDYISRTTQARKTIRRKYNQAPLRKKVIIDINDKLSTITTSSIRRRNNSKPIPEKSKTISGKVSTLPFVPSMPERIQPNWQLPPSMSTQPSWQSQIIGQSQPIGQLQPSCPVRPNMLIQTENPSTSFSLNRPPPGFTESDRYRHLPVRNPSTSRYSAVSPDQTGAVLFNISNISNISL